MPLLDFKEIPLANKGGGQQDTFELFARELLHSMGFSIVDGPDRGADCGRDIIAVEARRGIVGQSQIRWLVSCKHKAHSGEAVKLNDEEGITDRIQAHKCSGFIGFYSTIASSGLNQRLKSIAANNNYEVKVLDNEQIERCLLNKDYGVDLIKRFFPKSFVTLDNKRSANIFNKYEPLLCEACGKDLLDPSLVADYHGNVIFAYEREFYEKTGKIKYVRIYCACKGKCDTTLERKMYEQNYGTSWNDISDVIIPINYLKFIMGVINRMRSGEDVYTDEAFDQLKKIILDLGQVTLREQSAKEIQRVIELAALPDGI